MSEPLASHKIATQRITPLTTLIYIDGKLAMVNSVVSETHEQILNSLLDNMLETIMSAGSEPKLS